ncbi:cytochrome-c peroxidase, partial [Methylopila musalis]
PAFAPDETPRDRLRAAYAGPPSSWPAPWVDPGVGFVELGARDLPPQGPPTDIELGRRLFLERRWSAGGDISCASCHDPALGHTVRTPVATGHNGALGRRNPPTLIGVEARPRLDWDGRSPSLPARVPAPLIDPTEMGGARLDDALDRLKDDAAYAELTPERAGAALSAYVASLDRPTRFDRFARGEAAALTDQQVEGLHLFRTKARCATCHMGPTLTDEGFHNLGLSAFGEPGQDLGRHAATGALADAGAFRTPSLRHVADTAPYGHAGLFPTLEAMIGLYDRGGGEVWIRNAADAAQPLRRAAA